MTQTEGVIKFQMQFTQAPPLPFESLREIGAWRKICHLAGLIGQDPNRYGGFGFGNISQRLMSLDLSETQTPFIITGSQTGGMDELDENHYAMVTACFPGKNLIISEGPIRPSSESLTHGTLYALDGTLQSVIHVHSPDIWHSARLLDIPMTREFVEYGTPEMAYEIYRLFHEANAKEKGVFAMGGHEDGVVSFGKSLREAGFILLNYLVSSFQS